MNCLTEALGLSLPGNGSLLATHADRERCSSRPAGWCGPGQALVRAGRRKRAAARHRHLRGVRERHALDIAMGGSTNTVLHLLAAAHEGEVDFTMADIDRMSRKVPNLCKVAPATQNVPHGGRAPRRRRARHPRRARPRRADPHVRLPDRAQPEHGRGARALGRHRRPMPRGARALPGRSPAASRPRSPSARTAAGPTWTWTAPRLHPRHRACLLPDGGLAVLYGNLAEDGCIVKTAGVDDRS
jgi:dihydroxy-acid dehydratase